MLIAGDPRRLLHHLNLGVWSFLSEPAAGLLTTARGGSLAALPQGVAAGTAALAANTVFAFSNAAAKLLTSWRRSLLLAVRSSWPQYRATYPYPQLCLSMTLSLSCGIHSAAACLWPELPTLLCSRPTILNTQLMCSRCMLLPDC